MIVSKCAVMLDIELPLDLQNAVEEWVSASPDREAEEYVHLTALYVKMMTEPSRAAVILSEQDDILIPASSGMTVNMNGTLSRFGFKGDHLVMDIIPTDELRRYRNLILMRARNSGVKLMEDRYPFNPHVTLARTIGTSLTPHDVGNSKIAQVVSLRAMNGIGELPVTGVTLQVK